MNINTRPVTKENLETRLRELDAPRPDKVLFVKASGEVLYQEAGYGPTATAMIGAPAR